MHAARPAGRPPGPPRGRAARRVPAALVALTAVLAVPVAPVAGAPDRAAPSSPSTAAGPTRTRPLVVLDPGHGGSNSGALGVGLIEKELTMTLARAVRAELEAHGVEVALTRERDVTLTLRQRVVAANQRRAALFVSIHGNASPGRIQRGFETFVLTAAGVDVDGRALRSESGAARPELDPATALVLDDVERGACQWESAELAAAVQRELRAVRGDAGDRGVRQDAHHVLLGATMPAVLVEVGFIDHPIEGRELARPEVQAAIAGALARAIVAQLPPP